MALALRHIKGYSGRLPGGLAAHPSVPGQLFYVAGSSVVAMFEADATKQLQMRGHDDALTAFDLSPSGALLATGQRGANADVVIWDAQGLTQKFRFQEHDLEVAALRFSVDGRLLATMGNERERRVFVLDTATGQIVTNAMLPEPKRVRALAWAPVSSGPAYTFASCAEHEVLLWRVNPFSALINSERVTMGSVRRCISCLQFSPDGSWLFAGTASGDIVTINVARKAAQLMHTVASAGVGALVAVPGGRQLLVGAEDGSLSLFDWQAALAAGAAPAPGSTACAPPFAAVPGPVSSLSVAAGGRSVLVGTQHGDVFDVAWQQPAGGSSSGSMAAQVLPLLQSQQGAILGLQWQPGCIITASDAGTACVWDDETLGLQCRVALPSGLAVVAAQSVAAADDLLISGWADGCIRAHAYSRGAPAPPAGFSLPSPQQPQQPQQPQAQGAPLWVIPGAHALAHSCGVPALALSNHGAAFIASGGAGGELRVWDVASREMVCSLKHHAAAITSLQVLDDDTHLAASSEDKCWTIWDLAAERVSRLFRATMGAVRGVAVAPDQVTAVSVGLDRALTVWDVRCDAPVRTIPNAHVHEATCVAISHGGGLVASGGADCVLKTWDLGSGQALGAYAGHTARLHRLAFAPDDSQLASSAADGSVVLWRCVT